ncbi:MAG TPA: hypothetical protein VEV43_05460 [Actinomycetota bacterium]|nr:hypothetical protein [Actinomycetota bacterium]
MTRTKEMLYAAIGAGDLAVEKVKDVRRIVDPSVYGDLVGRGRDLTGRIAKAAPTKRAVDRTKTARSQAKAAATSVRKAVRANATAARSAAEKVAKAS